VFRELNVEFPAISSSFDIHFANKDHFYYEHNGILSYSFRNYVAMLIMKALEHLVGISYSCDIESKNLKIAIAGCNKINEQVESYINEIKKEVSVFYREAKVEGNKTLKLAEDLLENAAFYINHYRDMTNILINRLNSFDDYQQTTLAKAKNEKEKDKTLRVAVLHKMYFLIEALVKHGADIAAQGAQFKMNALHFSARAGDVKSFQALLENQPDAKIMQALRAKDSTGKTPSAYIRALSDDDTKSQMLKLIEKHILPLNQTASQLHRLRSMSHGDSINTPKNESRDDSEYKRPQKYSH